MRRKNGIIYMATAVLLVLAVFCGIGSAGHEEPFLHVEVSSGGRSEQLQLIASTEGYLCVLPGYARMEQVRLRTNAPGRYTLNGKPVSDGDSCADIPMETASTLTENGTERALTFFHSGGVDTMYIETVSGSMEAIHADREYAEPGSYHIYAPSGELRHSGSLEEIKGRGNATWWSHEKKPYSLTLGAQADLLGMGKAANWVLLANASDHTHSKNMAVLEIARQAGLAYTPRCQWVDLYLNGEYAGLYILSERNEIHSQRVDIPVNESFLVSMELESRLVDRGHPYVRTEAKQALRIHQSALDEQILLQVVQSAENAILADDGIDPVTGKHWQELIDLDSWAKKYLLEEIFGNIDACSISQFFYYDGKKLYAGPAWDYDVTMMSYEPNCLFGNRPQAWGEKPTPWFNALYENPVFYDRVVQLYETVYRPLLADLLETGMQDYVRQVAPAARCNQLRWQGTDPEAFLSKTLNYMKARMAFLDSLWLEADEFCFVFADFGSSVNGVTYAVRPGDRLPTLPEPAYPQLYNYEGWYDRNTEEPFDPAEPIYENKYIYLKHTAIPAEDDQWIPQENQPEEPLTLLRLGPLLMLLGLLTVLAGRDFLLRQGKKAREQEKIPGR